MNKKIHLISISIILLAFCGCGGSGGSGGNGASTGNVGNGSGSNSEPAPDTLAPDIHFDALGLQGSLNEAATVTVNDLSDQDALADKNFLVLINLGDNGLPADPDKGLSASGSLFMTATDSSTNVAAQELEFTIHH